MRYRHADIPRWSKYDIGERERTQLADQVVDMAAALGFEITVDAIRGVKFMERGDALSIDLDGGSQAGTAGRHYIEYPMVDREDELEPVTLKPDRAHRLLDYLHAQRWRQERRRAIEGLDGNDPRSHDDGDTLTRWSCAMQSRDPARIAKLRIEPTPFREVSHQCHASLRSGAGIVKLEADAVVLPFMVPETLAGVAFRDLGAVVEFPSCGDAALDAEMAGLMIHELESSKGTSAARTHTTIRLLTQRQSALVAGSDSRWRRLRAIRPLMMNRAPDYLEPDLEAGAVAYHAECDATLGVTTALPVRLEMAVAT